MHLLPARGSSSFTSEDLPSDAHGTAFGVRFDSTKLASVQFKLYMDSLGATLPNLAPDFNKLAATEADHEAQWRREYHGFWAMIGVELMKVSGPIWPF